MKRDLQTSPTDAAAQPSGRDLVLDVAELRAGYGHVPVLHGVSLQVHEGEAIGIVGHNGMGKTTLLKTLIGLLLPSAGRITLDGVDVTHTPAHLRSRMGIAYVPQGRGILPALSAHDNLRLAWRAGNGESETQAVQRVVDAFRGWRGCSTDAAARSRAASSRSWRWPARSCRGRGCCCWTNRAKASSRRSCRRSASRWRHCVPVKGCRC